MKKRLELLKLPVNGHTIEAGRAVLDGASSSSFACGRGRKECAEASALAQWSAASRSEAQQVNFMAAISSNKRQQAPAEEHSCSCQASSRCKCAANTSATINGLSESPEQRLKVSECLVRECPRMRPIVTPVSYGEDYTGYNQRHDSNEEEDADEDSLDGNQAHDEPMSRQELERKLCSPRWAPPTDGRQLEQRVLRRLFGRNHGNRCLQQPPTSKCGTSTSANNIVKHRRTSSRTLLAQLARLRRLNEPKYFVRRPEKVAEVERLIDELERAAIGWDEDEHLLDRAERRDNPTTTGYSSSKSVPTLAPHEALGERSDVLSLEQRVIESSKTHHHQQHQHQLARERSQDDLAIRRLTAQSVRPTNVVSGAAWAQPSYLLCMNSYVMPNNSNKLKREPELMQFQDVEHDRYLQEDDLHMRRLRSRLEAHEPPFGIPRQPAVHSSASHYLRRPNYLTTTSPVNQTHKRTDSRVSFASSVDSGLAGASPISRHTPVSPSRAQPNQQQYDNDDPATEIELEELSRESPGVELYRTEYINTPKRVRPKIRIEKPRAKSPLLTTSQPKINQQSQQHVAQDTTASIVRVMSYREARRLEEVECRYDFDNEEEEEEEEGEENREKEEGTLNCHDEKKSHIVRAKQTPKEWKQPSQINNEDSTTSNEDYRGSSRKNCSENLRMAPSRNKNAPLFSIGQYKHCESRANLRIL